MVVDVGPGWQLCVDESPEWLFFRLVRISEAYTPEPPLAARMWELAEQRDRRRLVFELDDGVMLTSFLVGQLVLVHKRAEMVRGVFRLCGFPAQTYWTLRLMGMADRFPNYRSREDAVLGRLA